MNFLSIFSIFSKKGGGGGGGGFTPTPAQQQAIDSGITSEILSDIETDIDNLKENLANFIGNFNSYAELAEYSGTLTNNDYAVVGQDETHSNECWRYVYNADSGVWVAQYKVNETPINTIDQSSNPTDTDSLSDLNGTTNKRWTFARIWNWITSKITGAISSVMTSNLTANKVVISNANGKIEASDISTNELNCLEGATDNVQDKIDDFTEIIEQQLNNLFRHTVTLRGGNGLTKVVIDIFNSSAQNLTITEILDFIKDNYSYASATAVGNNYCLSANGLAGATQIEAENVVGIFYNLTASCYSLITEGSGTSGGLMFKGYNCSEITKMQEIITKVTAVNTNPNEWGDDTPYGNNPADTDTLSNVNLENSKVKKITFGNLFTWISNKLSSLFNAKADKSTTLSGYGITDAYTKNEVDTELNKKLNLSGGTMTGTITTKTTAMQREVTNDQLVLYGGTSYNNGAFIALHGKDRPTDAGAFRLYATDGTNNKTLKGLPNGSLTWDGVEIFKPTHYTGDNVMTISNISSQGLSNGADYASNVIRRIIKIGKMVYFTCHIKWTATAVGIMWTTVGTLASAFKPDFNRPTIVGMVYNNGTNEACGGNIDTSGVIQVWTNTKVAGNNYQIRLSGFWSVA